MLPRVDLDRLSPADLKALVIRLMETVAGLETQWRRNARRSRVSSIPRQPSCGFGSPMPTPRWHLRVWKEQPRNLRTFLTNTGGVHGHTHCFLSSSFYSCSVPRGLRRGAVLPEDVRDAPGIYRGSGYPASFCPPARERPGGVRVGGTLWFRGPVGINLTLACFWRLHSR